MSSESVQQAANVTKYNAGGSGDNIVPDGYIKTVEKVWLDSFSTASITGTKASIDIAVLPLNKKITGIDVIVETSTNPTGCSIALGWGSDALANYGLIATQQIITHALTVTTLSFPSGVVNNLATGTAFTPRASAFQAVTTGTRNTIALQFNNWTHTFTSIKTIVRYT